jgi:hypothetical protein
MKNTNRVKTAQEHLENFIVFLSKKQACMEDAIKFLTVTQQHFSKICGGMVPQASINAVYHLIQASESTRVASTSSNTELKHDFFIYFKEINHGNLKYKIRLIKEIDVRKPHRDGKWGINITSLTLIK